MEFRIAATFTAALARLPAQDQKAVKTSAFDLQLDPSAPGLSFHRIENSKDRDFWSVRVGRDIRIIVHRTAASFLLAYVDHHDKAYAWAERRRIEAHPTTGALQIVEVRERVEDLAPVRGIDSAVAAEPSDAPSPAAPQPTLFHALSPEDLMAVGVPADWVDDVASAGEDRFFQLANHLPAEAGEALLEYATTGRLKRPAPLVPADPYAHPDALRRFRVVENVDELQLALDAPWEAWTVFLHPSQREVVERSYSGPARVAGSAGTGKTIVAVHRAARLARADPSARVLLTTFSRPLANSLGHKLRILVGERSDVVPRITVAPLAELAVELYQLAFGRRPHVPSDEVIRATLKRTAAEFSITEFPLRFLVSEWSNVIDPWQIDGAVAYAEVPRLGRKNRLSSRQRERLWPIFEAVRLSLETRGMSTSPQILADLARHYRGRSDRPFDAIVVDEAQDIGVAELRLLAAIAPPGGNSLFFAGDLGQRIFRQPFSWRQLGVDVRGRSHVLKVNYRTSHQIRRLADRLLPAAIRDVDGEEDNRSGTVSIFNGPEPEIALHPNIEAEIKAVADWLRTAVADGIEPSGIGIFVRDVALLPRARGAVVAAGIDASELSELMEPAAGRAAIGAMHLAKGLEFKAVVVMAADADVLPLQDRVEAVADEAELDDVYETERHLFYVACTRARDRLLVTGVRPGSEYLGDLASATNMAGSAPGRGLAPA